jgi:hypothetical protein
MLNTACPTSAKYSLDPLMFELMLHDTAKHIAFLECTKAHLSRLGALRLAAARTRHHESSAISQGPLRISRVDPVRAAIVGSFVSVTGAPAGV